MAGGNQTKSSLQKPPPSSSASSSHRKSRWESSNTTKKSPQVDPKSGDAKAPKPSTAPSPKTKPNPSPANAKHPTDQIPNSVGPARITSPGSQFPFPDLASMGPPPPPAYGFHMLERRTIVLADGSVRSYFALPPDYQIDPPGRLFPPIGPGIDSGRFGTRFPPGPHLDDQDGGRGGRHQDYWDSLGLDGRGGPVEGSAKRKFGGDEVERDELARQRKQLLHDANVNPNGFPRGEFSLGTSGPFNRDLIDPGRDADLRASKYMRLGGVYQNVGFRQAGGVGDNLILKHLEVDQDALKKAFLHFVKLINENATQKRNYLEDGKQGRLQCVACGRSSKDFPDMHALIMHTYNSDNAEHLIDHLGLHKALCVLMGWSYSKPPDNSKAYQFLSADEAVANQDDLIMWPPLVIIHNTITGKGRDGRMEGLGNKTMDNKVRDIIEELISKGQQLDAVHFTYEGGLVDKFPPVPLLKAYLKDVKKAAASILEDPNNAGRAAYLAARKELSALRAVIKCIEDYKLEAEFSPENLKKRLEQLEKVKIEKKKPTAAVPANKRTRAASNSNNGSPMPPAKAGRLTNNAYVSSFPTAHANVWSPPHGQYPAALSPYRSPPQMYGSRSPPANPYTYSPEAAQACAGSYPAAPMNYPAYGGYGNGLAPTYPQAYYR